MVGTTRVTFRSAELISFRASQQLGGGGRQDRWQPHPLQRLLLLQQQPGQPLPDCIIFVIDGFPLQY